MFDFLKKKIQGWIKPEKQKKKPKAKEKPSKSEPKKKEKEERTLTKSEKETGKEVEQILEQAEQPLEQQITQEDGQLIEEEKGNFFTRLFKKITSSKLTQDEFNDAFQDLEIILLENNVALETTDKIKASLASQLVGQQMKKTEAPARIVQALKDSILSVLQDPPDLIEQIKSKGEKEPFVIIFFGINGTGKTTSIAKITYLLQKYGINSVLAAADTFRAASIEQLRTHAEKIKVPVVSQQYGSDPAAVAYDAIAYAKKHNIKVVLIDTAGRMYTKANLMKEMEKIIRISRPDLKLFVGESITGNDVIEQAKTFNETIGINGIILTKADVDEKAGAILSVSHITGKPIYFLGTGQTYDDLEPFTKKSVLKNLGLE